MSTLSPTAKRSQQRTREMVQRSLESGGLKLGPFLFQAFLVLMLMISLGILVVLLGDILIKAWPTFAERGLGFVTSGLSLSPETAGVSTAIVGSVIIAAIVAVLAFPIGVAAAIYLEEYAPDNATTRWIDTTVRNLAGVPSIVYGLLGLAIFVSIVNGIGLGGSTGGKNVIAAGITMAVLVLPIVIITAAEALRAVPNSIREAGFGVGATRWEVIRSHVLPAAAPGILTGTVLTLARAFGETAPLLVIGVATGYFSPAANASVIDQLTGAYTALPVVVFSWTRQTQAEFLETLAPAAIVVLLLVLLGLNAAAVLLRNKYEQRW
jgi:phosphate transport system permease protein